MSELPLSAKEHEVVRMLASGMTVSEIANRFGISQRSVRRHVRSAIAVVARQCPMRVGSGAGDVR
mgnify:CR=1 FL=1